MDISFISSSGLSEFVDSYGYWAVFGFVALESAGLPLPGETSLTTAALYAGTTRQLDISLVIVAAAAGAIVGDNIGFWIGRLVGLPLALRYGHYVHLDQDRLRVGRYLFLRHGGKIVFFARFIAVLRAVAALLAGINQMPWRRFVLCNACGGISWAIVYGVGGYLFGHTFHEAAKPVGFVVLAIAALILIILLFSLRRHWKALVTEAQRAVPTRVAAAKGTTRKG